MISQLVNALLVRVHGANVSGFIANIYCSFSRNNSGIDALQAIIAVDKIDTKSSMFTGNHII